jgi:hypothetical protein
MGVNFENERDLELAKSSSIALRKLISYLGTWQDSNNVFGGLIATWWSSTLATAVPHPMNQFPIILGFLELAKRFGSKSGWTEEAVKVADGLIGMISPDGSLKNSWGDIPGKKTCTVIYAAPALAIAETFALTGDEKYRQAALKLLNHIDKHFNVGGINKEGVTNQALKWCEAMAIYGVTTGERKYIDRAKWIAKKYLKQQLVNGSISGGFYQGRSDDRLIIVYIGKCISPLVRLYEITKSYEFLKAASNTARFILKNRIKDGIFSNYLNPNGKIYDKIKNIPRLDRVVFRGRVPIYMLWRATITGWQEVQYPSFIARAADTISGIFLVSKYTGEFKEEIDELIFKLISFQYNNGGFPGSIRFFGNDEYKTWQDVCCPTRWNAYVFNLLCTIVACSKCINDFKKIALDLIPEINITLGPNNREMFRETGQVVEFFSDGECLARIEKPTGCSLLLSRKVEGDLSGQRSIIS